jgi:hypothetical protein
MLVEQHRKERLMATSPDLPPPITPDLPDPPEPADLPVEPDEGASF